MKDFSWLTPLLLRDVLHEYQNKRYGADPDRQALSRHVGTLVLHEPKLGALALQVIEQTPDIVTSAFILIGAGIQLGLRLAELKEELTWTKTTKTN
jgi:hypothetical protein